MKVQQAKIKEKGVLHFPSDTFLQHHRNRQDGSSTHEASGDQTGRSSSTGYTAARVRIRAGRTAGGRSSRHRSSSSSIVAGDPILDAVGQILVPRGVVAVMDLAEDGRAGRWVLNLREEGHGDSGNEDRLNRGRRQVGG